MERARQGKGSAAWTVVGGSYLAAVCLVGLAATVLLASQFGQPNWLSSVILLLLGCATASLKIHVPGGDRSVSLSFLFTFAAITEQTPHIALPFPCLALILV